MQIFGVVCGMHAYPDALRERVVAAYATGQWTISQVASRFAGSVSFVDKLLKRQRTRGSVAARHRACKKLTASAWWLVSPPSLRRR
jgi:transposase